MKIIFLFFVFTFPFSVSAHIVQDMDSGFINFMREHARKNGMPESEINTRTTATLKEFDKIKKTATLPKNYLINGKVSPLSIVMRRMPIILGAVTLYELCDEYCDYWGEQVKPHEPVTDVNPTFIAPSKFASFTSVECESNQVVIQAKDSASGLPEVKGWSIIPCFKSTGTNQKYVSAQIEPNLSAWQSGGGTQTVINQNFLLNGVLHQKEPLYYHSRRSGLPALDPGGAEYISGSLSDMLSNDPSLMGQRVKTSDVMSAFSGLYADGLANNKDTLPWVNIPPGYNGNLKTDVTVSELVDMPPSTTVEDVKNPPKPGTELETSTDGSGNVTGYSFPSWVPEGMPDDSALLVLYQTMDNFIKRVSLTDIRTGSCPVIDFTVLNYHVNASYHCSVFEFLRPLIGTVMMMIAGILSILVILRS